MAVTYDFQTPGVSTSAADTQEDIRNIAEASATLYNQSHSLSNIPTNAVRWNTSSKKFELYNGSSWGNLEVANIVGSGGGILSLNAYRTLLLSPIRSELEIIADSGNTGTTTYDPIVTFNTYITERARIYTDTSDSHKLKFDVGGSDQMVIDSSGNVGIGTSSPSYELDVDGAISSRTGILRAEPAAGASIVVGSRSLGTDFQIYNTDNKLRIYNGTSDALAVDTSGNVGIGTSSPSSKLEVDGSIQVTGAPGASSGKGLELSGNSSLGEVLAFDRDAVGALTLNLRGSTVNLQSGSLGANTAIHIDSSQNVGIGTSSPSHKLDVVGDIQIDTGNLVIGTSGKGIDFSATPGTGTSELLDDYEEGTFTPTFETDSGSFTSITHNRRTGNYTKIGNTVYCWIDISTNELTVGSASGNIHISGLPFTITAHSTALVGAQSGWITKAPDHAAVQSGQTKISLRWLDQSTQNYQNITVSNLKTGTNSDANRIMGISFSYKTS